MFTPIDCWNYVTYIHYNISMFTQNITLFQEWQQHILHSFRKQACLSPNNGSLTRLCPFAVCFCVLDHCVICVSLIIYNPGQSYSFRIVQSFNFFILSCECIGNMLYSERLQKLFQCFLLAGLLSSMLAIFLRCYWRPVNWIMDFKMQSRDQTHPCCVRWRRGLAKIWKFNYADIANFTLFVQCHRLIQF